MKHMHKYFAIAAATVTLATGVSAEAADDKSAPISVLFVQHAEKATLADNTLTLEGADKTVIIFTDRPHRAAATIPVTELVKTWNEGADSFASDPPNAALVGESDDGKPVSLIVEISQPALSESAISYQYTVIEGDDQGAINNPYVVIDMSDLFESVTNLVGVTTQMMGIGGSQSDFEPVQD